MIVGYEESEKCNLFLGNKYLGEGLELDCFYILVNFRSLVGKYFIWLCFIFNVFSDFIKRIVIGILLSLLKERLSIFSLCNLVNW